MGLLSRKIKVEIKVREDKPPLDSESAMRGELFFKCDLCDAEHVGSGYFSDANTNELKNDSWRGT